MFQKLYSKAVIVLVSVMFIVVGLIFFFNYDPDAYDVKASGTIVEIEEHYEMIGGENELQHTAYIDYQVGRETFRHVPFPSYNSKMKVGDVVEFYYMSSDPSQIAGLDKEKTPYIGLAFAVIGLLMLVVSAVTSLRKRVA